MKVYVDMDGVVADFDSHYEALTGVRCPPIEAPISPEEKKAKWAAINGSGTFFLDLPLMPGAMFLWKALEPLNPIILTATSQRAKGCAEQKREWCRRRLNLQDDARVIIVEHRSHKKRFCQPGDILIDDRPELIDQWNKAGGIGILFESAGDAVALLCAILEEFLEYRDYQRSRIPRPE